METPLGQQTQFLHWMKMVKPRGKSTGGGPAVIVLGAGILLLVVFLAMGVAWSMRASASSQTQAQKTVSAAFLTNSGAAIADVRTCLQVRAGSGEGLFRCSVVAPGCRRSFLFRVGGTTSRATPYDQPRSVFLSPCEFASDPSGDVS